jgi:photosystem II stability/assembly factor-like uncharacterized protein
MKNTILARFAHAPLVRLVGIIALAAVIVFTMAACDDGSGNTTPPGKSAGATVSTPTLDSKTETSITINAVTAPTNGQTVEYGKNTENAAPSTWQDGLTFNSLTAGTTYYIFARSKADDSYNAGTPSASLSVVTDSENDSGKSAGATVSTPTLDTKTETSITINAVTAPSNGQTVEYGKNTENAAPSTWQDGLTFSSLTAGTTYYIFARSKANDSYNAGTPSASLSVITSPLAIWTTAVRPFNTNISSIAYGDGTFVAVGANGRLGVSTDLETWNDQQSTVFFSPGSGSIPGSYQSISSVTYGNGTFVAGGWGGHIVVSTDDGTTWSQKAQGTGGQFIRNIIYTGNDTFFAAKTPYLLKSTDGGETWTEVSLDGVGWGSDGFSSIAYGNEMLIVGGDGFAYSKDDGATWTKINDPLFEAARYQGGTVAYGNGTFAAWDNYTNHIATSTDGENWTDRGDIFKFDRQIPIPCRIVYVNNTFVAAQAESGEMAYSTDGVNWNVSQHKPFKDANGAGEMTDIVYANGKYIAVGNNSSGSVVVYATSLD